MLLLNSCKTYITFIFFITFRVNSIFQYDLYSGVLHGDALDGVQGRYTIAKI